MSQPQPEKVLLEEETAPRWEGSITEEGQQSGAWLPRIQVD